MTNVSLVCVLPDIILIYQQFCYSISHVNLLTHFVTYFCHKGYKMKLLCCNTQTDKIIIDACYYISHSFEEYMFFCSANIVFICTVFKQSEDMIVKQVLIYDFYL